MRRVTVKRFFVLNFVFILVEEFCPMATSRRPRRTASTTTRSSRRSTPPANVSERGTGSMTWEEEHAYIYQDLRRLGIVSAAIFALLLVIGFFI